MSITFQDLPNELLGYCFSYLAKYSAHKDIQSVRLVSKRFHDVSSSFLLTQVELRLTKQSFQELESIASHAIFSKTVRRLLFNVSYYDGMLADSFQDFAEHNGTELEILLEDLERGGFSEQLDTVQTVCDEWLEATNEDYNHEKATRYQQILAKAHTEYTELYKSQQNLLDGANWLSALVPALKKLSALKIIVMKDSTERLAMPGRWWKALATDEGLTSRCLATSEWKGSFHTAISTQPPVHIIPDLFMALEKTTIRPYHFEINVTVPSDLRSLRMSTEQLQAISTTLSASKKLYFSAREWARRGSLAENNDRPRDEMAVLAALTNSFYHNPQITELHLSLDNYPCFLEIPTLSLVDLLPSPVPFSPKLRRMYLRNVPMTIAELEVLVEHLRPTLVWLVFYSPYLHAPNDESWEQALNVLRKFEALEHFELKVPAGGGLGDGLPDEELCRKFVMRESNENPLVGWGLQRG
ncbi:hypothetical protein BU24DRAFT_149652 [Aaosphaeria arxii CBS 175.79]|uniref:F-box domain-containing protein n=1 Tax=Aaosphaeria arxii CBS 175.79 TaxID=1450172 RepID=A0A6A5XWQ2_9PLEO|nr:uncharacterized protein BU24DRAFT_149652 [Aaosphaeria arxii CBS 175.79]KAF2017386.1 hypothetical protein BU24DRAFT_149652 [Aaosphaeria arxii CBS 175.79]